MTQQEYKEMQAKVNNAWDCQCAIHNAKKEIEMLSEPTLDVIEYIAYNQHDLHKHLGRDALEIIRKVLLDTYQDIVRESELHFNNL